MAAPLSDSMRRRMEKEQEAYASDQDSMAQKLNKLPTPSFAMDRWKGRVAVVTGASAGIGAAICKLLSQQGMKVVGCARRVDMIEEMAKEHPNITPYKVCKRDYN
jgi:3-oxoacyl-ACP reductase-like protein